MPGWIGYLCPFPAENPPEPARPADEVIEQADLRRRVVAYCLGMAKRTIDWNDEGWSEFATEEMSGAKALIEDVADRMAGEPEGEVYSELVRVFLANGADPAVGGLQTVANWISAAGPTDDIEPG